MKYIQNLFHHSGKESDIFQSLRCCLVGTQKINCRISVCEEWSFAVLRYLYYDKRASRRSKYEYYVKTSSRLLTRNSSIYPNL